jgi:SAM-dependent methyltransferase
MLQNQISNVTKYDRYPSIFKFLASNDEINILSFGCSTGEECNTLSEKYFPNAKIYGVDICEKIIKNNTIENKNNKINYFVRIPENIKFDIIYCMSVLCVWPPEDPSYNSYTFDIFEKTVTEIDSYLNPLGYLVSHNSAFCFTETEVFKKYKIVNRGFSLQPVIKRSKLGEIIDKHICIFQKNKDCIL